MKRSSGSAQIAVINKGILKNRVFSKIYYPRFFTFLLTYAISFALSIIQSFSFLNTHCVGHSHVRKI